MNRLSNGIIRASQAAITIGATVLSSLSQSEGSSILEETNSTITTQDDSSTGHVFPALMLLGCVTLIPISIGCCCITVLHFLSRPRDEPTDLEEVNINDFSLTRPENPPSYSELYPLSYTPPPPSYEETCDSDRINANNNDPPPPYSE